MKQIAVLMITCLFLSGWGIAGYCQDEESSIEQSESAIGQNLDSEIAGEQAQAEGEMGQMEESMDTGGASSR